MYDSGFITEGEYSDRFEAAFGEYIGNPNTCLVNSCTSALTLAAHMCDIQPGDEVITTAMTCMATNEPFYNAGAKLVFADIAPETGNITPESIREKITEKTKAIVVVHWAGIPARMTEIMEIANEFGIKVIEDAAHATYSYERGVRIGNHGDYVCFSFQAIKHLSTVDGGAIACKTEEDAVRIRKLRWFGLDRNFKAPPGQPPASRWEQDIPESGYKMHMNNVNAAIGLEQLKYLDGLIAKHMDNGRYYDQHILSRPGTSDTDYVGVWKLDRGESETTFGCHWIYSLLVDDVQKFKAYMKDKGIATDVVHVRNDAYSVFHKFQVEELPGLNLFSKHLIHIPVGWWVDHASREYIVDAVNSY